MNQVKIIFDGLQFMRTGNKDMFFSAEIGSRHSMDVDNIHWPNNLEYIGDANLVTRRGGIIHKKPSTFTLFGNGLC